MKHLASAIALVTSLALSAGAHASLVNFNNPGQIEIDNNTGVATYREAGFSFSGDAAGFLTLNDGLEVLPATALSLKASNGGRFSLAGLDRAFFDLGFGDPAGLLNIVGLLDGAQVLTQSLSLGALATFNFGTNLLTEVRFLGSSAWLLDNVNVSASGTKVPEPGSLGLAGTALLAWSTLTVGRHRRRRRL